MRIALLALALASCAQAAPNPVAIDGDTFDAGGVRYRLARIDAPEMPGHCRPGRVCAEGDPVAAKHALSFILTMGEVRCNRASTDAYGRTVAECYVLRDSKSGDMLNISDAMLRTGLAQEYKRRR